MTHQPHRLRERAVRRDVPYFEAHPGAAFQVEREAHLARAEAFGIGEVDVLAENLLPIAGNDFSEGEREGPFETRFQHRLGVAREVERLTALPATDGEFRDQHFAGRREKFAAT